MTNHEILWRQDDYLRGQLAGIETMKLATSIALGFGTEFDVEHNLAGLHSDIKDSDPVGAATLVRVMGQIAKVKSLLVGVKE
jgi:hypothetical protein